MNLFRCLKCGGQFYQLYPDQNVCLGKECNHLSDIPVTTTFELHPPAELPEKGKVVMIWFPLHSRVAFPPRSGYHDGEEWRWDNGALMRDEPMCWAYPNKLVLP